MSDNVAVIDVTNLEDCKERGDEQALQWIFDDARRQMELGYDILLHQTFLDSPPEIVERVQTRERLDQLSRYYLPEKPDELNQ